ncbi:ribose transport system substrate-binding protein [Paenibacillus phyllosphaerae]|uniref:Ribose transport system substrate-binding protein n=1 Tax=Paenibacillus phyllosphaerae TaxID=274593 RepID=A0A7W5ATL1_9BACL|nr:substrate-binding domain-containing protein [Paenibacillus phyllosphaerae]MBB3108324.1 ribose transport system substrate-binding protein [Paenibacillus phyllosphaerae]
MRKSRLTVVFTVMVLVVFIYAFFYARFTGVADWALSSGEADKNVIVILKTSNVRSDFWQAVKGGIEAAAKEMVVNAEIQGPLAETDANAQIGLLEAAILRKPHAIVVAPINDYRMKDVLGRVREAGIQLVLIDNPIEIESPPVAISNDHLRAGRLAGETAISMNGGHPKAAIISDNVDVLASVQRKKGIEEALFGYTDGIYGTYYSLDSEERAYLIAKSLLSSGETPFNTFITLTESATLGTAKAIEEEGQAGKVKLIGFESSIEEIQLLEAGVLNATLVQRPFNMGYLALKSALKLESGRSVEPDTHIESTVVTRLNMYSPENQKLLFPFNENE